MDRLDEALKIAKKWTPNFDRSTKQKFTEILLGDKFCNRYWIDKYVDLIKPYASVFCGVENKNYTICVSGLLFFYGCIIYICHHQNYLLYLEDVILYNLLYILVDNYIDSVSINNEVKNSSIINMFKLLDNPDMCDELGIVDEKIRLVAAVYKKLVTRHPNVKYDLQNLYKAEIEGLKIQNIDNHSFDIYKNICLKKGGLTIVVLHTIIHNSSPLIYAYNLGSVVQLVDDILDANDDIDAKINTIATYELLKKKYLDDLWVDTMFQIDQLPSEYTLFKILFSVMMVYAVVHRKDNFSEKLYDMSCDINLFVTSDNNTIDLSKCLSSIILSKLY